MEIRVDDTDGPCLGTVTIPETKDELKELTVNVQPVKGVHDLYFVFKGGKNQQRNLFMLDWWKFTPAR